MKKIHNYGDNLTLTCTINETLDNRVNSNSKRWYKENNICSLNNQSSDNTKYRASADEGGIELTILNFNKDDVDKRYHCEIGFYVSEMKILTSDRVFKGNCILKFKAIHKWIRWNMV